MLFCGSFVDVKINWINKWTAGSDDNNSALAVPLLVITKKKKLCENKKSNVMNIQ